MNDRSLIRRFASACALLLAASAVISSPAVAASVPDFTFRGTGWGHGIGLSQYGAQGAALAGKDYRWIVGHYYQNTTIEVASAKNVKVNIDPAATYTSGGNAGYTRASWRIMPGQSDAALKINNVAKPAATYTFTASGTSIVVTASGQTKQTLTGVVTVTPSGGSPPLLQVAEGTGIYGLPNGKYRGSLRLTALNGKIKLVNELPLEQYLYGVVPRESPSSWKAEALKAQAVVARSYAWVGSSELYCTTMSQAYQGYGAYNSASPPQWVGEASSTNAAVDATVNQVVKYGSIVVKTYFFSQSGGHTANVEDVWVPADGDLEAKAKAYPYLRGVPDTYEYLAKPNHSPWPEDHVNTYDGDKNELSLKLQGLAGVPGDPDGSGPQGPPPVVGVSIEHTASGHARYVTFTFANGAKLRVTGDKVRSKLGLLSTAFSVNFPSDRVAGLSRYSTAVAVSLRAFPTTAPAVVVASGEVFPDALAGSALAGAVEGSLLLTKRDSLPTEVANEIKRLGPAKVYILGSEAAVAASVAQRLGDVAGVIPERIAGADRYATASQVASKTASITEPSKIILASGVSWADAASASALAYAKSYPVLLLPASGLNSYASAFLDAHKTAEVLIVGGTAVLSADLEGQVAAVTGRSPGPRLAGSDRYKTAAAVARYSGNAAEGEIFASSEVYLATGVTFADALTGGVLAGRMGHPILLTLKDTCPSGTAAFLIEEKSLIEKIWVLGGPAAISQAGLDAIDRVMRQ